MTLKFLPMQKEEVFRIKLAKIPLLIEKIQLENFDIPPVN
jgi:hypothetical protein